MLGAGAVQSVQEQEGVGQRMLTFTNPTTHRMVRAAQVPEPGGVVCAPRQVFGVHKKSPLWTWDLRLVVLNPCTTPPCRPVAEQLFVLLLRISTYSRTYL